MKAWRQVGLALLGVALMAGAAHADSGEEVYHQVKSHIESMKDYTLQYDYNGPRGQYRFDYRCVRPNDVRTQIVAGSNTGAIILYRPEDRKDKCKAKKGLFTIWKDVNDEALKGTPMLDSVFDMALGDVANARPTLSGSENKNGHDCYVLSFNNGNKWWVDKSTKDIIRWEEPEAGGQRDERNFYNIQVNTGAKIAF